MQGSGVDAAGYGDGVCYSAAEDVGDCEAEGFGEGGGAGGYWGVLVLDHAWWIGGRAGAFVELCVASHVALQCILRSSVERAGGVLDLLGGTELSRACMRDSPWYHDASGYYMHVSGRPCYVLAAHDDGGWEQEAAAGSVLLVPLQSTKSCTARRSLVEGYVNLLRRI